MKTSHYLLCSLLWASALPAAETLPPTLEACITLKRDAERLLCFDRAVAQLKSGVEAGPATTPENMFGANSDVLGAKAPHGDVKREELKQISGSVTSLRRLGDGMIQL